MPPSDATIQQPDGVAAAAVPAAAARPPVAWAGPVTDPAKLRTPAATATEDTTARRRRSRVGRRSECTGIGRSSERRLAWCSKTGEGPAPGPARSGTPWVGGLGVERGGEDDRLGRRVVTERADEGAVGEGEDAAVGRHHQIADAVADHGDLRL